jgi:hypothetical protein
LINPVLGRVGFQRFENISVGICVAAEKTPKNRTGPTEVLEINPTPRGPSGFTKVEDEKTSARPEDSDQFAEASVKVSQIS